MSEIKILRLLIRISLTDFYVCFLRLVWFYLTDNLKSALLNLDFWDFFCGYRKWEAEKIWEKRKQWRLKIKKKHQQSKQYAKLITESHSLHVIPPSASCEPGKTSKFLIFNIITTTPTFYFSTFEEIP